MSQNTQTLQILNEAFGEIIDKFAAGSDLCLMSDILLQANAESGQLRIYDDDDNEYYSGIVEEWVENKDEDFYDKVGAELKKYIIDHADVLENLSLIKPYSFVLIDDDKETVSELHLVDDQLIAIDSKSLMENLDKDLDDFFDRLMKE